MRRFAGLGAVGERAKRLGAEPRDCVMDCVRECAATSACPPDSCFRRGISGDLVPWNCVGIHGKRSGRRDVSHASRSVGGRLDDLRVCAKISLRVCCRGRGCVILVGTSVHPPDSVSRTAPRVQESGAPRVVESDLHGKGDG